MKSLLVLQICFVFVSLVNAQTIPKSIDDPVKKKVVKPVKRGKPEEVVKKKETLSPSFFAKFSDGLVTVYDDKYGFMDKAGKLVIDTKYDRAEDFLDGLARVSINDKWGFIDKSGKVIIKIKYDEANDFLDGFARVKLNDKWGFIDKNGEIINEIRYDKVMGFSDGLAQVK